MMLCYGRGFSCGSVSAFYRPADQGLAAPGQTPAVGGCLKQAGVLLQDRHVQFSTCTEQVQNTRSTHLHIKNTSPKTVFTDVTMFDSRARVGKVGLWLGLELNQCVDMKLGLGPGCTYPFRGCSSPVLLVETSEPEAEQRNWIKYDCRMPITSQRVLCVRERWTDSTTESSYSLSHIDTHKRSWLFPSQ